MERISELRPDIVVVAVYWRNHADRAEKLKRTLAFLQEIGVPKVVVVGPYRIGASLRRD